MPVYLLRHGESQHNIKIKEFLQDNPHMKTEEWSAIEDAFDPQLRDAVLSEVGINQAREKRSAIASMKPSLVLLSPLARNLHTAHEACYDIFYCEQEGIHTTGITENYKPTVKILPFLREHTYSTCDLGSPPALLVEAWPQWEQQLSHIPERWWVHDCTIDAPEHLRDAYKEPWQKLQDRVDEIVRTIETESANHSTILIVGHAVLFYALTGKWMSNCDLKELNMDKLRARCSCSGFACYCENLEFDSKEHT